MFKWIGDGDVGFSHIEMFPVRFRACSWALWRATYCLWTMTPVRKTRWKRREWLSVKRASQSKTKKTNKLMIALTLFAYDIFYFCCSFSALRRPVVLVACLGCWRASWGPRTWPVRTWSQYWIKWRTTSLVGCKIHPAGVQECLNSSWY